MIRKCALFLAAVLVLGLCACTAGEVPLTAPVSYYYIRTNPLYEGEDSVIVAEERESVGHETDFVYLFQDYLDGPVSPDLTIPFPKGLRLSNHVLTEDHLYITLEGNLDALSSLDLSVASACIAKTCAALTGVKNVDISTPDVLANGSRTVSINADSLYLFDDSVARLRQTYLIYRADLQRRYLVEDIVTVQLDSREDVCAFLVRALTTPTSNDFQLPTLPEGTELLGVHLKNTQCTVDFSSQFLTNAFSDTIAQHSTLQSIVNTLTQLPYVDSVAFTVDGDPLTHYRMLDLRTPWVGDSAAVGPVRTAIGEVDATLYVQTAQNDSLLALPLILDTTMDTTAPELLAAYLLNFSYKNGYTSPIPAGTQLQGVYLDGAVCTVDVSKAFLSNPEQLPIAVRSVVSTMCSLKDISAVQITVDGSTPTGEYADLFKPLAPESD